MKATANQIVAYNLHLARIYRGWTQQEAVERLEPFLGKHWTVPQLSTAERSVAGNRVRQFDADEILAFARAFDVSAAWFLMPPMPDDPLRPSLPDITPPKDAPEAQLLDEATLAERSIGAGHDLSGRLEPVRRALGQPARERLTHQLEDEARAWWLWHHGYRIIEEQDRRVRELEKRGELPLLEGELTEETRALPGPEQEQA
jgi:hypothetical protein